MGGDTKICRQASICYTSMHVHLWHVPATATQDKPGLCFHNTSTSTCSDGTFTGYSLHFIKGSISEVSQEKVVTKDLVAGE